MRVLKFAELGRGKVQVEFNRPGMQDDGSDEDEVDAAGDDDGADDEDELS